MILGECNEAVVFLPPVVAAYTVSNVCKTYWNDLHCSCFAADQAN